MSRRYLQAKAEGLEVGGMGGSSDEYIHSLSKKIFNRPF
jgi:hypothetical protein